MKTKIEKFVDKEIEEDKKRLKWLKHMNLKDIIIPTVILIADIK